MADPERTDVMLRSAVGLLGDVAEAFPNGQVKAMLQADWVNETVKTARSKGADADSRTVAKWAKEVNFLNEVESTRKFRSDCVLSADDTTRYKLMTTLIRPLRFPSHLHQASRLRSRPDRSNHRTTLNKHCATTLIHTKGETVSLPALKSRFDGHRHRVGTCVRPASLKTTSQKLAPTAS